MGRTTLCTLLGDAPATPTVPVHPFARRSAQKIAVVAGLTVAALTGATLLASGCTYAADNPDGAPSMQPVPAGGTPDGIVLHKFDDAIPRKGKSTFRIQPMSVYGFDSPIRIRNNIIGEAYGQPFLVPEGRLAKEYGITEEVIGSHPFGPMPGAPVGLKGMFGYTDRDGFRASPRLSPNLMDIAEAIHTDGRRELLVANGGLVCNRDEALGDTLNIEPYRFVYLSAVSLYRMEKPAPGQKPELKCVLTYVHPGWVHDINIEQWKDANGKNHIICLCGGNDDIIGKNAVFDSLARNGIDKDNFPPFSMNAPSIFYLSFYPKGPVMFADEELTDLDNQPFGLMFDPSQGAVAGRFWRENAEFGYRQGGVLVPFPSVDLTKWQGDMDFGYKRPPDPQEMPGLGDIYPIRQIYSVSLGVDGQISVQTCMMYMHSPMKWVPEEPGSVNLGYMLTPEGLIL